MDGMHFTFNNFAHCFSTFSLLFTEMNTYRLHFLVISRYRRVVIILEIDVIKSAEDVPGKIGDPTPYSEGKA